MTSESDGARLLKVLTTLVEETQPANAARITLDCRLERDLGLDSLGRVELLLRLGREFGAALPDAALAQAQTPRDLLRYLGAHGGAAARSPPAPLPELPGAASGTPEKAATLVDVLRWHAAEHAQRTHVVLYADDQSAAQAISYGELLADAERAASGLIAHGLRARQTVALMLPTGRAYLTTLFATLLAGGIPVPIYPPTRLAQIDEHLQRHAQILANAQATFIVTEPAAKAVAAMLRARVPDLPEIVDADELSVPALALRYRAAAGDLAFLQYTSGSTGNPKGVALTHANLLANLRAMGARSQVSSTDVFVSWLPLYHDMGLIGAWFGSLYFACPLILMSPLSFLARPVRWLQAISRHRGTISAAPNFAYQLCAAKLTDADLAGVDLASWRLALNGAEPVSADTLDAFAARFAAYGLRRQAITPVYGLAECSVGLAFPPLGRGPRIDRVARERLLRDRLAVATEDNTPGAATRIVACGYALPGHAIRIVDADGSELPERQVGRLQFRGPSATSGYYRNAAATRALLCDGWLDSGDLAYRADGEVFLTGRSKDLIIRGGRNIYPYELEQAVGDIAGIRRGGVAVFASGDAQGAGERLVVVAETRVADPDRRATLRRSIAEAALDIIGVAADEVVLAPPNSVLKTSSGKIRRAASREAYERGLIGAPGASAWRLAWRLQLAGWRAELGKRARSAWHALFALWCWSVFALIALPVAPLVALAQRPALARRLVHAAARLFFAACGMPLRATGLERLGDADRLLLVNHCSYVDALALCALLPPRLGYAFVAKRELAASAPIDAFLRGLGSLYVERFAAARSAEDVQEIVAALRADARLVIFPEGTFSREAGLQPFHSGAFVSATRAGVALRVAALDGTRQVLRDESWRPRRGRISLTIGDRLAPAGDDWTAAIALRDAARQQMLAACGEPDLAG